MLKRRDVLALSLAALSGPASGQARYPDRPIRLVVPFPPGGAFDAVARPWANMMKSLLGTVVVENIGGAGSSLGAAAVARAMPDVAGLERGGNPGPPSRISAALQCGLLPHNRTSDSTPA